MNKEERVVKYINSSDDPVFNGKRYCENDFYNDVEDLAKENQELKKQQKEFIEYLENEINIYPYDISDYTYEDIIDTILSKYEDIIDK